MSHNFLSLKNEYKNPLVSDGDRKKIMIQYNGKVKNIVLSNFYQKDVAQLFDLINCIVLKRLKIKYKK